MKKIKKFLSLTLAILMLPVMNISVSAMPVIENNQEMEEMVLLVKNRLEFQDSKKFTSTVSSNEDGATNKDEYRLNWEFEDYDMSVSVRDDGVITQYHYYPKTYKERTSLLFTVTKEQAKQIANDFIKKINPDIYSEYELVDIERNAYSFRYANLTSRFGGDNYIISYVRKVNGIPFKPNTIEVSVSGFDGYVESCNTTYHKNVIFDNSENVITKEQAMELFKNNLDLEYSYNIKYNYEEKEDGTWESIPSTVLVYRDKTDNKFIDATTGELFIPHEKFYAYRDYGYAGGSTNAPMLDSTTESVKGDYKYTLTEEEKNEIIDTKDVLQPTEVVSRIKALNLFNIPEEAVISSYRLFKNDDETKEYSLSLKYLTDDTYITITADANTAEVKRFRNNSSYNYSYHDNALTGYKEYAVDFVNKYFKDIDSIDFKADDKGLDFMFYRIENNIPCYDNYISVNVDKETKKINYYNTYWTEVEFINPANAISLEDAKNVFIENFKYSLFYYLDREIGNDIGSGNSRAILAWDNTDEYSRTINAHTKEFLSYDYETLKLPTVRETIKVADKYTDISGHWAENVITIMQNNNVGVISSEFKPNELLTYETLFELLGNIATEKDFEEFKDFIKSRELKGLNFVNENTKLTDTLTREEYCSLMVAIGNYNYDKIIDNSAFFNTGYVDADKISTDKVGYIAIAKMLKYLSGNTFRPLDKITRAEAITYLYNIYTNL